MNGPTESEDHPTDHTKLKLEIRNFSDCEIQEIRDSNHRDYKTQDPIGEGWNWADIPAHYPSPIGVSHWMYKWSGMGQPKHSARDTHCPPHMESPPRIDSPSRGNAFSLSLEGARSQLECLDTKNALNRANKGKHDLDNLDFLKMGINATATLVACAEDGSSLTIIRGLDLARLIATCPLLGCSFEEREMGYPMGIIVTSSKTAAICLLHFIYTNDYEEDCSYSSLLLHAQVYKLAEHYELPDLQAKANQGVFRETKISTSNLKAPDDLCEVIRFIYENQMEETPFLETILRYCVKCFSSHGLGSHEDFKSLAFEMRSFTKALCRINCQRRFQDEGALDIVRLQTAEPISALRADPSGTMWSEYMYDSDDNDLHSDIDSHPDVGSQVQSHREPNKIRAKSDKVVSRPNENRPCVSEDEEEENDWKKMEPHGFTLVLRPKALEAWDQCGSDADCSSSEEDAISNSVMITKPADRAEI